MTLEPHPDTTHDWQSLKAINRGGMQSADDAAMEAYWLALDGGASKEEANNVFSDTYKNCLHGNKV